MKVVVLRYRGCEAAINCRSSTGHTVGNTPPRCILERHHVLNTRQVWNGILSCSCFMHQTVSSFIVHGRRGIVQRHLRP